MKWLQRAFLLVCLGLSMHPGCSCQGDIVGGQDDPTADGGASSADGGGKPPLAQLAALTVTPPSVTLTVDDLAVRKTQAFRAVGRFTDGRADEDVTALVNWRLDVQDLGAVDGAGVFTTSNQVGGRATLTASSGAVSGAARIEVSLQPILRTQDAPQNADVLLPPANKGMVLAGRSPVIVYPSDKTLFPRNLYKVLFQWNTGTGNDLFRLEFKGDLLNLSVYTTKDRWEPTAAQWAYLAGTAAGGKLTWTVYGVTQKSPGQIWASTPIDLGFTRGSVEGAIYYWSTTVAGVRRATVSDAAPANFLTPAQTGECVACHTLSRNGKRLAADVGGHVLGVVDVKNINPPVINWSQKIPTFWTTFNPDTSLVVTANKGVLSLRDGMTGQELNKLPTGASRYGTQPDWSPDGKLLTFAQAADNKDRGISGSSIAVLTYDSASRTFGNLRVIVASTGKDDSNYYPSFSPDSRYIAFVNAKGGSDNNNTARLLLVSADGSQGPVALDLGNTVVNNQTLSGTAAQLGNSMPTWAPTRPGEPAFLAFSSVRAYGKVYAYKAVEQLWVMGVDLSAIPGKDPSFPAFRLPFQDLDEDNHRPFWAEDALAPPPPPPDGGTPVDGGGGACVPQNGDCLMGARCCTGLYCAPSGNTYTCQPLG
jgi:hypothetical protein